MGVHGMLKLAHSAGSAGFADAEEAAGRRGAVRRSWPIAAATVMAVACMVFGAVALHYRHGEEAAGGSQGGLVSAWGWSGEGGVATKAELLSGDRRSISRPLLESLLTLQRRGVGLALGRVEASDEWDHRGGAPTTMLAANESATEKAMRDFAVADRMASLPDDLEAYRYDANCNGTEVGSYAINVTSTGREGNRTYHVLCEMGDGSNTTFDVTVSQVIAVPPVEAEGGGGGESQGEGGSDSGGGNSTSSESDVDKNATDSGGGTKDGSADEEEDDDEDTEGKKKSTLGHRGLPGWDKGRWNNSDWITWLSMGPLLSGAFCVFVFYQFGAPMGIACVAACAALDVLTFYFNW